MPTTDQHEDVEVRWAHMFPDALEQALDACPVVYFPYGLCGPNGPHAAVGLPALNAEGLLVETARTHGGVVAPTDAWHVHEIGGYGAQAARRVGEARPWLTSVPPWVHFRNVCYHVRAAEASGFHAALLVSGHRGPHQHDLRTLIEWLQPYVRLRLLGVAIEPSTAAIMPSGDTHAGRDDTSLLTVLAPDAVDLDRLPPAPNAPGFGAAPDAAEADHAQGTALLHQMVNWLGDHQRRLLKDYDPDRPSHFQTFDDVETFWARSMRPRLRGLHCMRDDWASDPPPSATSRWMANWHTERQAKSPVAEEDTRPVAAVQNFDDWRARAGGRIEG